MLMIFFLSFLKIHLDSLITHIAEMKISKNNYLDGEVCLLLLPPSDCIE